MSIKKITTTKQGFNVLRQVFNSNTQVIFSKVATTDTYFTEEEIVDLIAVDNIKQETNEITLEVLSEKKIKLKARISNDNLTESYYAKTIIIYAKDIDNNEFIFAVSSEEELSTNYLPSSLKVEGVIFQYELTLNIDDVESVTVDSSTLIYASSLELEAHKDNKIATALGVHGLRYDKTTESLQLYDDENKVWYSVANNNDNLDIIDNLESNSPTSVLSANQGKVLDSKITAQNTTLASAIEESKVNIVDNLESNSPTSALSAAQGKILDDKITSLGSTTDKDNPASWGTGTDSVILGANNEVSGDFSSAIGYNNTVSGDYPIIAAGYNNIANGNFLSVFGYNNTVIGSASIAFGFGNTADNYNFSIAMGYNNTATGERSCAFGAGNKTIGDFSVALGYANNSNAFESYAFGYATTVNTACCTVIGRCNAATNGSTDTYSSTSDGFVVGIGYHSSSLKNGLRIVNNGAVYGGTYYNSGADYAEFFEWKDGNTENIDRIGLFVCIEDGKIKLAESSDDNIIGTVSGGTCSIIGDAQADEWCGKYARDIFGRLEYEWKDVEHEIVKGVDDDGNEIIEKEIKQEYHMKLNPDYDPNTPYVPRAERQEWDVIGLLGKLILIDDGTCSVGDYCTATTGGIATKSLDNSGFMVLERIDDSHIKILKI